MKAVIAAFNQEKALVGAFSVITNLRMELFEALILIPVTGPKEDTYSLTNFSTPRPGRKGREPSTGTLGGPGGNSGGFCRREMIHLKRRTRARVRRMSVTVNPRPII